MLFKIDKFGAFLGGVIGGGGGGAGTDLTAVADDVKVALGSSTGTGADILGATDTLAGVMTAQNFLDVSEIINKLDLDQIRTFIFPVNFTGYNVAIVGGDPSVQGWDITDVQPTGPRLDLDGDMTNFANWHVEDDTVLTDGTAPTNGFVGVSRNAVSPSGALAANSPGEGTPTISGVVQGGRYQVSVDYRANAYDNSGGNLKLKVGASANKEQAINGDFSLNSDWDAFGDAVVSINTGTNELQVSSVAGTGGAFGVDIPTVVGQKYTLKSRLTQANFIGGNTARISVYYNFPSGTPSPENFPMPAILTDYEFEFTAQSTTTTLYMNSTRGSNETWDATWTITSVKRSNEDGLDSEEGGPTVPPSGTGTFVANVDLISGDFSEGDATFYAGFVVPPSSVTPGNIEIEFTSFEIRELTASSVIFPTVDAYTGELSLFFDDFSATDSAFMRQVIDPDEWLNQFNEGNTQSMRLRVPVESLDGVRLRWERSASNAVINAAGYTFTNNARIWFDIYNNVSTNSYIIEPNGDNSRAMDIGSYDLSNIDIFFGPAGVLSGVISVLKSDGSRESQQITLDDTTYSDSLDYMYFGSDTAPAQTGSKMWLIDATYINYLSSSVLDIPVEYLEKGWNILIPPGSRNYSLNVPDIDGVTFEKVSLFAQNTGTITLGRLASDAISVIQSPVTKRYTAEVVIPSNGGVTLEISQITIDENGDPVNGRQYNIVQHTQVSSVIFATDSTELLAYNANTGNLEPATEGVKVGGSQALAQSRSITQYSAVTTNNTEIVDYNATVINASADDAILTLDFGDPSLIASSTKGLNQTHIVSVENGGSVTFKLDALHDWFGSFSGVNEFTIDYAAEVRTSLFNSGVSSGGVVIIIPAVITPDNTSQNFIPLKKDGKFENSAVFENALSLISSKHIHAPSMTLDVGSLHLGGAISMSVGGEFTYLKDDITGEIARILIQNVGDTLPQAPVNLSFNADVVRQPLKTDDLVNPMFTLTPPDNEQIIAFKIHPALAQTNVVIQGFKSGVEFYKINIGSVPEDVEFQIDLLIGDGVPIDVFDSTAYEISVTSEDGDVTLKGINAGTIPFYEVTYYEYEFQELVTANLPINQEVLIEQSSVDADQSPVALDTPLRINFGAAFGTGLDPIEMDATGLFTCNVSGTYFPTPCFHYGRTSSAGEVELYGYLEVDGLPQGTSTWARLDDDNTSLPFNATPVPIALTAGQTFAYYIVRDSSLGGINDGGLFQGTPVSAIPDAPSAKIIVSRLVGNAASIISDGDVTGPGSSNQNEIATFANLTGKEIAASSDIKIVNGIIERITSGEDIWLKTDITAENIFIGRHNDATGVPSLGNTSLVVTANSTNSIAMVTLGNNSQSISFTKAGTFRGSVNNNRDRNSIGLENATGEYIEIRPDKSVVYRASTDAKFGIASSNPMVEFQQANGAVEARIGYNTVIADSLVISKTASNSHIELATNHIDLVGDDVLINGAPIATGGAVKAYAHNTASNTSSTTMTGTNQYVRCNFGTSMVSPETSGGKWLFSASRFQNTGALFKGVVTFICDIAHSDSVELLYDCRVSINNETNLQGIWRQLYVPVGKSAHMVIDAYVEVDTNDYVQLNIKQPNGTVNFNPVMSRTSVKIE